MMIRSITGQRTIGPLVVAISILGTGLVIAGGLCCAGPLPLGMAIDGQDEEAYAGYLRASGGNAAKAYTNWMASERGIDAEEVRSQDEELSETRNPFDAYRDPRAVSRGAVIYKMHCVSCHGEDARGDGPASISEDITDFKSFGQRFAATLHRGAPRKWFRVIRDGSGLKEKKLQGDAKSPVMPAFGNRLTREQIWLVITYLQSLDVYASDDDEKEQTS